MDFIKEMFDKYKTGFASAVQIPPLVLAYVGDAVLELYIRTVMVGRGGGKVGQLHKMSTDYVSAKAQAGIIRSLTNVLTEQEADIVRRGRNVKPSSLPRNADIMEYRYATGFETLIGYLYLAEEHERLAEILELSMKAVEHHSDI